MLSRRETAIALVANGIAVYSILQERGEISDTLYKFVFDSIPAPYKPEITSELIDSVFESVTTAHNS